jgi:putative ABC transport system permease protein
MIRIALRTMRFRKGAFVATFLAMTFGAMLVMACGGLMETGIRGDVPVQRLAGAEFVVAGEQSYGLRTETSGEDQDTNSGILSERVRVDDGLVSRIEEIPGVETVVGDLTVPATVLRDGQVGGPTVDGHGWASAALSGYELTAGRAPAAGEVVLGSDLGHGVGDRVELVAGARTETFTVSGLGGPGVYFADVDATRLAGHPGKVDLIGVITADGADLDAVGAALTRVADSDHTAVLSGADRGVVEFPEVARATEDLIVLAAVFGGLATTVAVFVVSTTLGLSVQQRQRELALLRAIGTTPGQLRRMVIGEALLMSVFATALGCLLGSLFGPWLFDRLAENGVVPVEMVHHANWIPMIIAAGAGILTSLVGAFVAGRRAARTRPTEALADAAIQRRWLSGFRLTLALLAFGGGLALFIVTIAVMTGPIAASTAGPSVMLWAIGLALIGPGITKMLLALLRGPVRLFSGTSGQLAVLSTKTRAVRVAAVVVPIMLATGMATSNIYLQTTTVELSRQAFVENLRADLVVGSSTGGLAPSVLDEVRQVPGVTAASEFATSTVYVADPYDDSLSEEGWPVQGVTADAAAQTVAVDVREGSLADLTGATIALPVDHAATLDRGVGDTITMRMGDGADVDVRIVALYPGQEGFETLLMPAALVAEHTTAGLPQQIMVRADGDVTPALTAALADHPGVGIADREALIADHVEDQQIGAWINYLMAGMIIAYTAISVVNSLVMSIGARRREFGLQRLTGSTRSQVMRMMTVEAGMATVIGVLLGTVVAAMTLIPFTLVAGDTLIPSGPIWIYLAVIGAIGVLTFGSTLISTWAGLRTKPVVAAAAA